MCSRKVTSASSAEYFVACATGTQSNVILSLPLPVTSPKAMGVCDRCSSAEFVHAMAMQAAFQHIGHQHGVIDGIEPDAALQEHQRVIFQVLAHLQDAIVFQQRLQPRQHIGLGHLDDSVAAVLCRDKSSDSPSPLRWPQGM